MEKEIDLDKSPLLLCGPEDNEELLRDWEYKNGQWSVENGVVTGLHGGNSGGILYSKNGFDCDVLLDFVAEAVAPCHNDLNFTWCSQGWDYEKDDAGISYIAGLGGWWENKVGIEQYPECTVRAATGNFKLESGKKYHVQAGSIDGHCFIFVDSILILELMDPTPIDKSRYNKVGMATYASHIRFENFTVRQIVWSKLQTSYSPDF